MTPKNDQRDYGEIIDSWLAKRIRWVLGPIMILSFLIGQSVQIPQIYQMRTEIEEIKAQQTNNQNFIVIIEKGITRLLDRSNREEDKRVFKEIIEELREEKDRQSKSIKK